MLFGLVNLSPYHRQAEIGDLNGKSAVDHTIRAI